MSLINQMLRDLEQRRTAEAGVSPLGGLSASGTATQSMNFSINYTTLAMLLAGLFMAGVVMAYLLGSQQQVNTIEKISVGTAEKITPILAKKIQQSVPAVSALPVKAQPVVIPISAPKRETAKPEILVVETAVVETPVIATPSVPTPAAEKANESVETLAASMSIEPATDAQTDVTRAAPDNTEQNINKSIRPLTDKEQSQSAFQHAIKILGRSNPQGAQIALEEALSFAPTHIRARETLAALLLNEGRVSEAASSLRDGLQLMPSATLLAKLYARILVDQGDISVAVDVLERARPAVFADPEYYALLAALYRQEKKHAQAAQTYQQILMQRPGVASWWMGLALSQDAMGENEKALDAFQRAIRAGGLSAEIMQYMRARIVVLTPVAPVSAKTSSEFDEFGE